MTKPQEQPRPKSKGPRRPYYGDENYKGAGVLICHMCGLPIRDHDRVGQHPDKKKKR